MGKANFFSMLVAVTIGTLVFSSVDSKACCVFRVYPVISAVSVDPATLWPPNHKMQEILLDVQGSNIANWWISGVNILNVGQGEGDPANDPDYAVNGRLLQLRAERSGKQGAREYVVSITATSGDQFNTSTTTSVSIIVPHDLSGGLGRQLAPGQQ